MTGIEKIDGSYRFSYKKKNGELIVKGFGYYTNRYPTEKLTRIVIEKDSIKFDEEMGNYINRKKHIKRYMVGVTADNIMLLLIQQIPPRQFFSFT